MPKKNVLVTGGTGFIRNQLVDRLLEQDHSVTVLDEFPTGSPQNLAHLKGNTNFILKEAYVSDLGAMEEYFKFVLYLYNCKEIHPKMRLLLA